MGERGDCPERRRVVAPIWQKIRLVLAVRPSLRRWLGVDPLEDRVRLLERRRQESPEELLLRLIEREVAPTGLSRVDLHGDWSEAVIEIGPDHTARVLIDDGALAELRRRVANARE